MLDIRPSVGTIPAHSSIPITVFFTPQHNNLYRFNLTCQLKVNISEIPVKSIGLTFFEVEVPRTAASSTSQLVMSYSKCKFIFHRNFQIFSMNLINKNNKK